MYSAKHLLVYSMLLFTVGVQCNSNRAFEIIFANCTIEPNLEYMDIQYTLKNAGTVQATMTIKMKVLKQFPADLDLTLRIERDVYGNYVTAGMPLKKSLCDFIKNDRAFYPTIYKYTDNAPRRCPIKAGDVYVLTDFNMNQFDLPMAILPNGEYRVIIELLFPGKSSKYVFFSRIQSAT